MTTTRIITGKDLRVGMVVRFPSGNEVTILETRESENQNGRWMKYTPSKGPIRSFGWDRKVTIVVAD